MNEIYEINDLLQLEDFLHSQNSVEKLREKLFAEFLKYADYKSVSEWKPLYPECVEYPRGLPYPFRRLKLR